MSEQQKESTRIATEISEIHNNSNNINMNRNKIEFDLLKITGTIKEKGTFKENDNIFEFSKEYTAEKEKSKEEDIDTPKFIVDIKTENAEYLGILTDELKKELYGYNLYDNGDEYFGQWNRNKKDKYGIYYFKETEETKERQIYIGEFCENVKQGEGIYLKIKNYENEEDNSRPYQFTFAIGNFEKDNFEKGIIYDISENNKIKIYKGKLNIDGKKEDNNAVIYENGNKLFSGRIKNNIMMEGRVIILREDNISKDEKEEAYYFKRKEENSPDEEIEFDYRKGEETDEELIKKMKETLDIFDKEKLKDLYMKAMEFREKIIGPDKFKYMKELDFDNNVKLELKALYGRYIYV